MECFGENEEWVRRMCSKFQRVRIWEHHKRAAVILHTMEQRPQNLAVKVARFRTGCMVAVRELGIQLTETQTRLFVMVQDHELGIGLNPNREAFLLGLQQCICEWDITKNPQLFAQLEGLDPDVLIREGQKLLAAGK